MTRVALFVPCFVDQLAPQVALDMATVLKRVGFHLYYPTEQTCCGQPAFNAGYWEDARPLAQRFVRVFRDADMVVCPSGSCTALVRHSYPELLANTATHSDALELGKRVFEFSEFLVDVAHISDAGAFFPKTVTYHDSCHLLRELGVKEQPRKLLRAVRGLQLVEMNASEECCGFGGVFSVKFPEISGAMGDVKVDNIVRSGAEYVTACDPSCLMQIDGILRRRNTPVKAIHLASILANTEESKPTSNR